MNTDTIPASEYRLDAYDYTLPQERIAQLPSEKRDASRLLVVDCSQDTTEHRHFADIVDYFDKDDLLVLNDTRVFPARLQGKKESGGRVEMFLLEFPRQQNITDSRHGQQAKAMALLKSSKRPKEGSLLLFSELLTGTVISLLADGRAEILLQYQGELIAALQNCGKVPLPPYIHRQADSPEDRERYQTVFARHNGAVAAPTAGLHFTDALLREIRKKIQTTSITLHVGYGTFAPVRTDDVREHTIHEEFIVISDEAAQRINRTKDLGGRIWAVGTTTARTLEYAADNHGRVRAVEDFCGLYIYPGFHFKVVNNLITNFHLPRSSLLFLVSALAGRERILKNYQEAIDHRYRFYSYGDAMAIITKPAK